MPLGTNVGESLLTLLNRESNNMVQGVIVVSDGRSQPRLGGGRRGAARPGPQGQHADLHRPVGEDRQPVNIRITDVQTPEQTPPDEKFVVRAEIDGEGLPDQEVKVFLDIYKPDDDKPSHTLETTVKFQPGEPPHAQAEFAIDPEQLPPDLKSEATGKKELDRRRMEVRRPRAEGQARGCSPARSTSATRRRCTIIKKPLRVLLVASGPMKDYQFVRTLFVREKDAKRAELSIFLQNEGRDGRAVQDVEPERLLNRFPTTLRVEDDPNEKPEDKYYNLAQYDLIIAFDPDWSEFTAEQIALLQKWVDTQAGGLILIAGPVNTFQLARDDDSGRLKPLLDLFPVVPGDSVLQTGPVRRHDEDARGGSTSPAPTRTWSSSSSTTTRRSRSPAGRSSSTAPRRSPRGTPKRGFFSFYPVKSVKPGATVVATFTDPAAKLDGKEHPFLVTQQFGKGRVVFVGSGGTVAAARLPGGVLRAVLDEARPLRRAGSRTRQNRRGVLVMGRQFTAGQYVRLEAQLFGPSLEPLPKIDASRRLDDRRRPRAASGARSR